MTKFYTFFTKYIQQNCTVVQGRDPNSSPPSSSTSSGDAAGSSGINEIFDPSWQTQPVILPYTPALNLLLATYPITQPNRSQDSAMIDLRGHLAGLYVSDRVQFNHVLAGLLIGRLPLHSAQATDSYMPNSPAYAMYANVAKQCVRPMESASVDGIPSFTCPKDPFGQDSDTHYQCPSIGLSELFTFFFSKPCSPECQGLGTRPAVAPFALAANASAGCIVEANNTEILYRALGDTCGGSTMSAMGMADAGSAAACGTGCIVGIIFLVLAALVAIGGIFAKVLSSSATATPMGQTLKLDDSASEKEPKPNPVAGGGSHVELSEV